MGLLSFAFKRNSPDSLKSDSGFVKNKTNTHYSEKPFVDEPPIPEEDLKFYEAPEYYTDFIPSLSIRAKNGMLRVQSFSEAKESSFPSQRGLYIGEIALVYYCSFGNYPNPKYKYPGFWWFEYGMKNIRFYLESLEQRGFIKMQENGKYYPTELGNLEVKDNYYVVYMRNAPGMTIDNIGASDRLSVWEINRRLAGGDPTKWESILMQIWQEIDDAKRMEELHSGRQIRPYNEPCLAWDEIGFRHRLDRISNALNIVAFTGNSYPVSYLQALMRQVLDSFLFIEHTEDISQFFEKIALIKNDLRKLSAAESSGIKFSYSPSSILWDVEKNELNLFLIVVENSSAAQLNRIHSLKTDRGRISSNQRWKDSIDSILDEHDEKFRAVVQKEYDRLENLRKELDS